MHTFIYNVADGKHDCKFKGYMSPGKMWLMLLWDDANANLIKRAMPNIFPFMPECVFHLFVTFLNVTCLIITCGVTDVCRNIHGEISQRSV